MRNGKAFPHRVSAMIGNEQYEHLKKESEAHGYQIALIERWMLIPQNVDDLYAGSLDDADRMMRRPLISGASLSELLASAGGDPDEELSDGETPDEPETVRIDPDCAEKLEHARGRILNLIKEKRPRFVPAFELMTFRDNTISVSVPTTELREEILRSKTGMLMRIAELAGIEGMIELEVTVNEEIRAARPIKLEDRVRYITEKNPLVAELRKALDLEVE